MTKDGLKGDQGPETKASSSKRISGRPKKTVNYVALQEIKIETGSDMEDEIEAVEEEEEERFRVVTPPIAGQLLAPISKRKRKREEDAAAPAEVVTEGKCGQCAGCKRVACDECSFCNIGDPGNCIDLYCMNQKEGRSQREAAREAYLMSLGKSRLKEANNDEDDDDEDEDESGPSKEDSEEAARKKNLSIQQQIDMIMDQIGAAQKYRRVPKGTNVYLKEESKVTKVTKSRTTPTPSAAKDPLKSSSSSKRSNMGVYGGSPTAAKTRRCGECEGCMRDDCGQCNACADKPRFGGRGTKKKACILRYCRTRKLEEDHAQANFPLNSADALKGPRPVTKLGKPVVPVEKVEVQEDETVEDAILQD